jgi:hypothetical protein
MAKLNVFETFSDVHINLITPNYEARHERFPNLIFLSHSFKAFLPMIGQISFNVAQAVGRT